MRIERDAPVKRNVVYVEGQRFEIERSAGGEYRLRRLTRRRNAGLVKLLLACPVKDWFVPLERSGTTTDVRVDLDEE